MTDYLESTADLAERYCPGCHPNYDPTTNKLLLIWWCNTHEPSREGIADSCIVADTFLSGSNEAGGESNRLFCDFFHRGKIAS